ncbi:MAG: hypothetical protein ACFBSE_20360 [Prochloraceae cyanobacterium]
MNKFNKLVTTTLTTLSLLAIPAIINPSSARSLPTNSYSYQNINPQIYSRISNYYFRQGYRVQNISQNGNYVDNGFVIYQYTVYLTRNGVSYTQALNSYTSNNRVYATIFQNNTQTWTNWFLI